LAADSVPIYALAAAIAWASLVTVEFYERIYRDRIESNHQILKQLGDEQLKQLAKDVAAQVRKGSSIDSKIVDKRLNEIRPLLNAQETLMNDRKRIFFALALSALLCIGASAGPALLDPAVYPPWGIDFFAYLFLAAVFVLGFLFLFRMFEFDKTILTISRAPVLQAYYGEERPKRRRGRTPS
jgi:hypothetical protein